MHQTGLHVRVDRTKVPHGTGPRFHVEQDRGSIWNRTEIPHGTGPRFHIEQDRGSTWNRTEVPHGTGYNLI